MGGGGKREEDEESQDFRSENTRGVDTVGGMDIGGGKVGVDNDKDGPVELTEEVGWIIISQLEQVVKGMDCVNTEEDRDHEAEEVELDHLRETHRRIFLECAVVCESI